MVSGSCWLFAAALVEVFRVTSEAMWEGRRLLTSSRMITSPTRNSVSAPVETRRHPPLKSKSIKKTISGFVTIDLYQHWWVRAL
jgi:hypothetical protein